MELILRVGSTSILNKGCKNPVHSSGFEENQSKERPYFVVEKYYDYEERHYPSCTAVATKLKTKTKRTPGIVERYLRLKDYFRGQNELDYQINRLTPALTKVESQEGSSGDHTYTITLAVDQQNNASIPKPKDSDLYLTTLPPMNVYVKKCVGRSEDKHIKKEVHDFKKSLCNHDFHQHFFYTAGYDSPFKMFNARNEIWFVKK